MSYATRKDLYTYGLPRGSLGSAPSREVASSRASTDVLELDAHGLVDGDGVTFRAIEGGTLPSPLVAGTKFYAIRLDDARFKVAASEADALAGIPINLTTDGDSVMMAVPVDIEALLKRYSRFVDGFLPAHAVPLEEPYPLDIVAIVAELTAAKAQFLSGTTSVEMGKVELSAKAQLERYVKGLPVREVASPRPTNLAVLGRRLDPERRLP